MPHRILRNLDQLRSAAFVQEPPEPVYCQQSERCADCPYPQHGIVCWHPDYGVVYDNGMKLKQVYQGREFPCYYYEPNPITIALTSKTEPEDTEYITWLFLPMVQEEIDCAIRRASIADLDEIRLRLEDSQLPDEVDVLLDMEQESLSDLNLLAQAANGLSDSDINKLGAVVALAKPKTAVQIKNLIENLDLFDFTPGAHTPEEYGKYMIRQSGHFDYDENLDDFYDYAKYGVERMNEENGMFTDRGYIAYKGYLFDTERRRRDGFCPDRSLGEAGERA